MDGWYCGLCWQPLNYSPPVVFRSQAEQSPQTGSAAAGVAPLTDTNGIFFCALFLLKSFLFWRARAPLCAIEWLARFDKILYLSNVWTHLFLLWLLDYFLNCQCKLKTSKIWSRYADKCGKRTGKHLPTYICCVINRNGGCSRSSQTWNLLKLFQTFLFNTDSICVQSLFWWFEWQSTL